MDIEAVSTYFAMGGHATYIWPAYGLAAIVLGGLLLVSLRGLRKRETMLKQLRRARRNLPDEDAAEMSE